MAKEKLWVNDTFPKSAQLLLAQAVGVVEYTHCISAEE